MANPPHWGAAEGLVVVTVLLEGSRPHAHLHHQAKAIVAHAQVRENVEAEAVLERWRQIDPELTLTIYGCIWP